MATAGTLKDRYEETCARVADAARRSGRRPQDVILVAVTKFAEPDEIRELVSYGHRDFGENKVQQLSQRAAQMAEWLSRSATLHKGGALEGPGLPESVRWHMVGRLQRNKVKKAIESARLIHGIDSLRLAEEIQVVALRKDATVDVLLQVNASGEGTKAGVSLPAALHLAEQIDTMVNVRLRGLMTMAPEVENPEEARPTFRRLRECFEDLKQAGVGADHNQFNILSMGMTNDFEVAISEGANVVRIGSAIFGERTGPADDEDEPREGDDD